MLLGVEESSLGAKGMLPPFQAEPPLISAYGRSQFHLVFKDTHHCPSTFLFSLAQSYSVQHSRASGCSLEASERAFTQAVPSAWGAFWPLTHPHLLSPPPPRPVHFSSLV